MYICIYIYTHYLWRYVGPEDACVRACINVSQCVCYIYITSRIIKPSTKLIKPWSAMRSRWFCQHKMAGQIPMCPGEFQRLESLGPKSRKPKINPKTHNQFALIFPFPLVPMSSWWEALPSWSTASARARASGTARPWENEGQDSLDSDGKKKHHLIPAVQMPWKSWSVSFHMILGKCSNISLT